MLNLKDASRDELIRLVVAQRERITALEAVVAEQRAVIARLEATVAQLTQRVGELLAAGDDEPPGAGTAGARGMPGLKLATGKRRPPKQPRKGRAQSFIDLHKCAQTRCISACKAMLSTVVGYPQLAQCRCSRLSSI